MLPLTGRRRAAPIRPEADHGRPRSACLDEGGAGEAHAERLDALGDERFDVSWAVGGGCLLAVEGTFIRASSGEHGSNDSSYDWTFLGAFDGENQVEGDAERFLSTTSADAAKRGPIDLPARGRHWR